MILYNPKDHPDDNLPSQKLFKKLAKYDIDAATFLGNDQHPYPKPRIHHGSLHHLDYHENIFSWQSKRPGAVIVTVNSTVGLLRFTNLCPRPITGNSEAFSLAEIILQNGNGEDWVISLS